MQGVVIYAHQLLCASGGGDSPENNMSQPVSVTHSTGIAKHTTIFFTLLIVSPFQIAVFINKFSGLEPFPCLHLIQLSLSFEMYAL